MGQSILVTGSAGFVGSTLAYEFLNNGHEVVGVDNYSNSNSSRTDKLKQHFEKSFNFIQLDLASDTCMVEKVFSEFKPQIVCHYAGLKSVSESDHDCVRYWANNTFATINLLKQMERYKCLKLIFSSSAAVYGESVNDDISENAILNPMSTYGKTKVVSEEIISDFAKKNSLSAVTFRFFNLLGSHKRKVFSESYENSDGIMANIIKSVLNTNRPLEIYGLNHATFDGTAERDFIHIEDVIDAHLLAFDFLSKQSGHQIFNLGTGRSTSLLELVEAFQSATGQKVNYKFKPAISGELSRSCANMSKLKEAMQWQSKKNLQDMCLDDFLSLKKQANKSK